MKQEQEVKRLLKEQEAPAEQTDKNAKEEMLALQEAAMEGAEDAAEAFSQVDEAFLADIRAQEQAMQEEYPGFSLKDEMQENPLMATMLACGERLRQVYTYFHPEALYEEMEREIVKNIQARGRRPAPVGQVGSEDSGLDVSNLTAEQMAEIDRRVRRGERVTF